MQLCEAYTTLQNKLQQYEETGRLTPRPDAMRSRFLAFAEADLMPLTRRLATILTQAGIPAYTRAQLEEEAMWFGLFLNETWSVGIYVQPLDAASMQLSLQFNVDSEAEEHHILLYRKCTRATFATTLERAVERLLMQTWEERRR
ncbi:MAG TPA: hypothetical protein PK224_10350 [Nitrospira sp.]|nr:hypothetical protein [Nitrospira sp.]